MAYEDNDGVHAYCLDCGTKMNDKTAEKDPFIRSGNGPASCRSCGGVVAIMHKDDAKNAIRKNRQSRGLPS